MFRQGLWLLALPLAGLIVSCKDATQASVMVRTNVAYEGGSGIGVWASRSGAAGTPLVESAEPWLADGELGDVVVVPGDGAKDGALTVRVAMGLRGKRAAECTDEGDAQGCIVARRKLSFVPHARLRVPVVMYLACEGVKCDQDSTCSHLGQCVPAQVDPQACANAEGCALPGEPPFVSGVVPRDAGADNGPAVDAGVDAGVADAGVDTGVVDAGVDTGVVDAGISGVLLGAGTHHTCARLSDGTLKCWGWNSHGQLGLGDTQPRGDGPNEMGVNLPAVDLGPGPTAVELTAGYEHTCARLSDGAVKCWGYNFYGELGLGDTQPRGDGPNEMGVNLPAVDLGLVVGRSVVQLAAGLYHTCARLSDGMVKCWGRNDYGQLGLGDVQSRGEGQNQMGASLPLVNLGLGRTAVELAAGLHHTCARLDDGTVKCWGRNDQGQLGLGDTQLRGDGPNEMGENLPVAGLGPGRTAVQLTVGQDHACARLDDGTVKCWGLNDQGQLGLGDVQARGDGPNEMGVNLPVVDLGPGRTVVQIAAGVRHTCARLDDGTVKCWGRNNAGQLGLGDTQIRGDGPNEMGVNLPALDLGPEGIALTPGGEHTCARLDDGRVKCWGWNLYGQLGLGDNNWGRGDEPNEMGANLLLVQLK